MNSQIILWVLIAILFIVVLFVGIANWWGILLLIILIILIFVALLMFFKSKYNVKMNSKDGSLSVSPVDPASKAAADAAASAAAVKPITTVPLSSYVQVA